MSRKLTSAGRTFTSLPSRCAACASDLTQIRHRGLRRPDHHHNPSRLERRVDLGTVGPAALQRLIPPDQVAAEFALDGGRKLAGGIAVL